MEFKGKSSSWWEKSTLDKYEKAQDCVTDLYGNYTFMVIIISKYYCIVQLLMCHIFFFFCTQPTSCLVESTSYNTCVCAKVCTFSSEPCQFVVWTLWKIFIAKKITTDILWLIKFIEACVNISLTKRGMTLPNSRLNQLKINDSRNLERLYNRLVERLFVCLSVCLFVTLSWWDSTVDWDSLG